MQRVISGLHAPNYPQLKIAAHHEMEYFFATPVGRCADNPMVLTRQHAIGERAAKRRS